ncbi:uncharacterized protein LOC110165674 [Boleophthalmus pectinirostris]|uniref:uncharacterized protein LOC110165674 n=1 Tax=Boleophthalmus pectinirostris TaxID=150288 RepID=UPI00242FEB77|nr:uncharacterized protein LOC110165674 [Boleophthalmus pectinirostris]
MSSSGSAHGPSGSALDALSCHFTWGLTFSRATLIQVRDKLMDIVPEESATWRGQNYNLQGFLQHRLGRSSEALSLLRSASEALRGPELLVNYSDLAWLHHERGEHEQSQEYLSRVEVLRRENPTEGEHPEVLAEKAWTLMKFGRQQKLEAVDVFEAALEAEPERVEWRSAQVIALASAKKHDPDPPDAQLLQRVQRAHEDDPENLYLHVLHLSLRQRCGDDVLDDVSELEDRIMVRANSSFSGLKAVLRIYRNINHPNGAIKWAEKALDNHPDSRYVKHCVALCYKWRVLFRKDGASQRRLLDRAISLYEEVLGLYPDIPLVKEIDLADLYSRTERSRAEEMYRRLLQRNMEPPEAQMLYNRYAKYLKYMKQDVYKAIKYHKKAAQIDHDSFFRDNSLKELQKHTRQSLESILEELQSFSLMEPLEELQCHFTWELKRSRFILFSLRDRLEDLAPEESATWRGQNYNLQGFLQHRLGRSSEALSLLHSASEALRGPKLLVNYSDLAWLHHERGEHEQSHEYLSRVEALRREYPTEGEHPEVLAEKAFSLMEFYNDKNLLAAELLDEALRQQPDRREWLSAQAVALVSAHRHSDDVDEKVLLKIKRAMDKDPENLQLQAEYLNLRVQREESAYRGEQSAHRGEQSAHRGGQSAHREQQGQSAHREGQSAHRGGRGWGTGEELRAEVSALASQLLQKPQTLLRDIKCVLELQRRAGRVDEAVALANAALRKRPDSRYLKASLAMCLKWQLDQQGERASQELMEQAAELLGEVASLYPESCLRTELDRANVYAKSNRGLAQAQRLYQDLILRDLEPVSRQMVLNQYAKFLKHERHDYVKSMEYHMRAAEIPSPSFYRTNSITVLRRLSPRDERLRRRLQLFLENLQDS